MLLTIEPNMLENEPCHVKFVFVVNVIAPSNVFVLILTYGYFVVSRMKLCNSELELCNAFVHYTFPFFHTFNDVIIRIFNAKCALSNSKNKISNCSFM